MPKKLLMGNEAIALGAIRAGVSVVTGYPGTPSTEVLETVAKYNESLGSDNRNNCNDIYIGDIYINDIYIEWSVNEKTALEVAAGAAFAGARVMVTMKQVGLNVASDPLMSLNYLGVKGGMVIVVADDPGPISSQTEQDTRHFAKHAKLALFDPSTPEEAYIMIADAFALSEQYGEPVLFRPTTRVCHSCASVEILDDLPRTKPCGFVKDPRWVIFPKLTYANKFKIEDNLKKMSEEFSKYKNNILTRHSIKDNNARGIISGGVSYAYTLEALASDEFKNIDYKLLKISAYPFPDKLAVEFLSGLDEVLVIEELDPVIENELLRLCGLHQLKVKILGKGTGHIQIAGENSPDSALNAIKIFFDASINPDQKTQSSQTINANPSTLTPNSTFNIPNSSLSSPALPIRPPVLCAGCPHRASFFAVKEAAKNTSAVFSGDIGCYTLGNVVPLSMTDTCVCMGAGITIAQGLQRAEPDTHHFAFIGDSTFFHTGIPGVINAVYNQTDIIVCILDNSTTAMTGNQPHPGIGITMMNTQVEKIDIEKIIKAIGVSAFVKINPFNQKEAVEVTEKLMKQKGVRVILFESPCIKIKGVKINKAVNISNKCTGCKVCINKLGCPAISFENKKAVIDADLCTGCGLCIDLCPLFAIENNSGCAEADHAI